MGNTDRYIRIGLSIGLGIVAISVVGQSPWTAIGLGVAALILLTTALVGSCPLYLPFGISTRLLRK